MIQLFIRTASVTAQEPPFLLPSRAEISRLRTAAIYTTRGTIYVELYPEDAPWHVANFKYRADMGLFRNQPFTIVRSGYIAQGGSNRASSYSLPAEFSERTHEVGTLGMARREDAINPERRSDGSQFHLLLSEAPHMNGKYTIFGKVIQGLSVLPLLREGDRIKDVEVYVRGNSTEAPKEQRTPPPPVRKLKPPLSPPAPVLP